MLLNKWNWKHDVTLTWSANGNFFGLTLDSPGLPPDWASTKKVCCGDSIWDSQFQWIIITFPSADILKKNAKINWTKLCSDTQRLPNLSNSSSTGATKAVVIRNDMSSTDWVGFTSDHVKISGKTSGLQECPSWFEWAIWGSHPMDWLVIFRGLPWYSYGKPRTATIYHWKKWLPKSTNQQRLNGYSVPGSHGVVILTATEPVRCRTSNSMAKHSSKKGSV